MVMIVRQHITSNISTHGKHYLRKERDETVDYSDERWAINKGHRIPSHGKLDNSKSGIYLPIPEKKLCKSGKILFTPLNCGSIT